MVKLNEYFNKVSNDNRIFTREDISKMTTNEFKANEKAIDYQLSNLGIPKNSRGVIYDINSVQSKKLFNSPEIQGYISKNYPELINNKQNSVVDINFTLKQKFKGTDNFLGLQHCKLYNPQITSDGHFIGTIVDYYDFKYRPLAGSIKEIVLNYVNNWGYFMQEKSFLENQFNIYQIREKLW